VVSSVPFFRSVSGSALACHCSSWWLRPARSGGGVRLVARFASFGSASAFARRWAGAAGCRFVAVRRCPAVAGAWVVSVPVVVPASSSVFSWGAWSALP
jgi:hypothetical protein